MTQMVSSREESLHDKVLKKQLSVSQRIEKLMIVTKSIKSLDGTIVEDRSSQRITARCSVPHHSFMENHSTRCSDILRQARALKKSRCTNNDSFLLTASAKLMQWRHFFALVGFKKHLFSVTSPLSNTFFQKSVRLYVKKQKFVKSCAVGSSLNFYNSS